MGFKKTDSTVEKIKLDARVHHFPDHWEIVSASLSNIITLDDWYPILGVFTSGQNRSLSRFASIRDVFDTKPQLNDNMPDAQKISNMYSCVCCSFGYILFSIIF